MRFCFLPLLPLLALLGACSKTAAPVRLDFIGNPALTSGSKVVNPGDTLTTRAYAVGNDHDLVRLRITVSYAPTRTPIVYPVPATGYNPKDTPNDDELVYLDSVLVLAPTPQNPTGRELVLQNQFAARTTSGTELWRYTVTDAQGASASRAYRLTVRNPDSLRLFHAYTARLRPVPPAPAASDARRDQARVFLSLRSGLLLPQYAVLNRQRSVQANQPLVDLIGATTGTAISLSAPAAATARPVLPAARGRRTRLLRTGLSAAQFGAAGTAASFAAAYAAGQPFAADSLSTGPLVNGTVLAFKTTEGYTGLLLVSALITGTVPLLNCSIKVQK